MKKSMEEWKKALTPLQYNVLRQSATERPFTGEYNTHFASGTYGCAGCGQSIFDSSSKFDSKCGWPAFDKVIDDRAVSYVEDSSLGMKRMEVLCSSCGGHLGHVFDDGPTDSSTRFCINSAALGFVPSKPQ